MEVGNAEETMPSTAMEAKTEPWSWPSGLAKFPAVVLFKWAFLYVD